MNCMKCSKAIVLGRINYYGVNYHSGCFVCGACKQPMRQNEARKNKEEVYHFRCFQRYKADDMCEKCGKLLTHSALTYRGKSYHENCFTCGRCFQSLAGKSFHEEDGLFYDTACYNALNSLICDLCQEMIAGDDIRYVTFHGKFIHHSCFRCSNCRQQLNCGERFHDVRTTVKGALICIRCSNAGGNTRRTSYPSQSSNMSYMRR